VDWTFDIKISDSAKRILRAFLEIECDEGEEQEKSEQNPRCDLRWKARGRLCRMACEGARFLRRNDIYPDRNRDLGRLTFFDSEGD
jgi:hypothetical protein